MERNDPYSLDDDTDYESHPEYITEEALNNFPYNCLNRQPTSESEEMARQHQVRLHTKLRDLIDSNGVPQFSEKMLDSTKQDFFDDVDRAIQKCGLEPAALQLMELGGPKMRKAMIPVYIALREMGYSHLELIT